MATLGIVCYCWRKALKMGWFLPVKSVNFFQKKNEELIQ